MFSVVVLPEPEGPNNVRNSPFSSCQACTTRRRSRLAEERRKQIVAVARRHNVLIIEDAYVYRPLLDATRRRRHLPAWNLELTVYVGGLSKCVAPGLRLGFVDFSAHVP